MVREVRGLAKGLQGSWIGDYKAHTILIKDLGSDPQRRVKDHMQAWSLQGGLGLVEGNVGSS